MTDSGQITLLLRRIRQGDRGAEADLVPIVYGHLHRLAQCHFLSERPGQTLHPTALISDLYLRLIHDTPVDWQNRAHFYAVAAATIRRILVDHARAVNAQRRPNPNLRVQFEDVVIYSEDRVYEILLVDQALCKLREWDARQAKVVELRYFGGLSLDEIGEALGVSKRSVSRDWNMARAWLSAFLNDSAKLTVS